MIDEIFDRGIFYACAHLNLFILKIPFLHLVMTIVRISIPTIIKNMMEEQMKSF